MVSDSIFHSNALEFLRCMADSRTEARNIRDKPAESSSPESKDVLKTKQKHRQGHMPMEQEPTGNAPNGQSSNNLSNKKE